MKWYLGGLLILSLLLFGFNVSAKEVHFSWDANPEPDIQCYRIYEGIQVDVNIWTWSQVGEVNVTEFTYDIPDDTLRLFRVSAIDISGAESIRWDAGVFICFSWEPPVAPSSMGAE